MPLSGSLVPSLAAHGMRVAFGLPGAHTVPLYGARARRVRHEQSATFMALTTTGPGLPTPRPDRPPAARRRALS